MVKQINEWKSSKICQLVLSTIEEQAYLHVILASHDQTHSSKAKPSHTTPSRRCGKVASVGIGLIASRPRHNHLHPGLPAAAFRRSRFIVRRRLLHQWRGLFAPSIFVAAVAGSESLHRDTTTVLVQVQLLYSTS